jgi:radical SAM superfamily enzyme YgiQ (UPF0313 family)
MSQMTEKRRRFRIVIPAYPAFNIYSSIAKTTTALGPVCVGTAANEMKEWDVEVIDENNLHKYNFKGATGGADHKSLQEHRPADVLGLYGGLTSTIPRLYSIARFYKQKGAITIAGGQHFSDDNIEEALSSGIDYVVIGEGEETIKELLSAIEQGRGISKVKGLAYLDKGRIIRTPKREPLEDFEKLPLPDFSLVRYARINLYPVGRIRGCGMNCEFCTVKGRPRYASAQRLLACIRNLSQKKGARHFFIVDDLFGQQRDETIRFCNMLKDYQRSAGLRLDAAVQIRLDKAKDTALLSAMRQAGISAVAIGFESPIEEELRIMDKRINAGEMLSLVKIFRKFGFLIHGMFIFGYPLAEETNLKMSAAERVRRFGNFIKEARVDTIQVLLPVPLPGTALRDRLQRQNRIYPSKDIGWEYYDGNFPLFEPDKPMSAEQMQASIKKIMSGFYRFKYIFIVVLNIFTLSGLIFYLHNIKSGWRRWYRYWRNCLYRIYGWIIIRRWSLAFKKDMFLQKLQQAKLHLKNS